MNELLYIFNTGFYVEMASKGTICLKISFQRTFVQFRNILLISFYVDWLDFFFFVYVSLPCVFFFFYHLAYRYI